MTTVSVSPELTAEPKDDVDEKILHNLFVVIFLAKQSEPGCVLSSDLFSEQEREGKKEAYLSYFACNGLFNITGNMVYENVAVCTRRCRIS